LAEFIYFAINNLESLPNTLNVGLGYDFSINDYYEEIANLLGFAGSFKYDLTKPVGMRQKLTNIDKLSKLGWEAPSSLSEGLSRTIRHYRKDVVNE
jgi:GDP-L-fucose synthase